MTSAIGWFRQPEDPPRGRAHPTGGYDEVEFDRAKGEYRCLLDGELHRVDGPAAQTRDENRYYRRGVLHRANGPAVVRRNGQNTYYLEGTDCGVRFALIMTEVIVIAPKMVIRVHEAYQAYVSGLSDPADFVLLQSIRPRHTTLESAVREVKETKLRRRSGNG